MHKCIRKIHIMEEHEMNNAIPMAIAGLDFTEMIVLHGPTVVGMILRVVLVLVVFAIGRKVIGWAVKLVDRILEHHEVEITIRKFLKNVLIALAYVVLAMIMMEMVGIAATSLAAAFASCGVAIGLALQGSLSNFAGGILILLMKPFVVGNYVVACGMEGTVKEIGLVYTKLTTTDNREVLIPNGSLANSTMINVSANPTRRVDITVGVGYTSDLKLAQQILKNLGEKDVARLVDQDVTVFVSELGASSVNLGLRLWVDAANYWSCKWRLTEQIKEEFDKAGIEIPFNQLDVHMK